MMRIAITCLLVVCALVPASWGQSRVAQLTTAFAQDHCQVIRTVSFQGQTGVLAEHITAYNYETHERKRVYYVEGNGYQMGYLMGLLAHEQVERMSTTFVDKIIFAFIGLDVDPNKIQWIWNILKNMIVQGALTVVDDIPPAYIDEIRGLVDGCKAADPQTKVTFNDLLMLNVGIDCLLSVIYNLDNFGKDRQGLDPHDLRLPVMCNAFAVFGNATVGGRHYLGRDFMFPTAGVFQDTAAMIIYRPTDGRQPLVAMSAPGFVGAITAMNRAGVGSGVDMSPAGCCNPERPGLNSLLMVRHAIHQGQDIQKAIAAIIQGQRGVTWNYIVADGRHNKAAALEAGCKCDDLQALKYPPQELQEEHLLPDAQFIQEHAHTTVQQGLVVRWHDYNYPQEFLQFNRQLFAHYGKTYDPDAWGPQGYLNATYHDKNLPKAYYFAPQRENKPDVLIMINHFVIPVMRLTAMNPLTVLIAAGSLNDIQWRYDELNHQVLAAYGHIDYAKAQKLIEFLAPYHKFPDYYQDQPTSSDGQTIMIHGCISLCDLTAKTMESHYGYYADQWVKVTLPNYLSK